MGNQNGRENHVPTGSPLDFYYTPPTSLSEAELAAMALPSTTQTPSPSDTALSITSSSASWTQKVPGPSEWAVISVDSISSSETKASNADGPASQHGGMEAPEETAEEEMTLVLLSLMEHYGAPFGLSPTADITTGAVELLRHLITEREQLEEELDTLKDKHTAERSEWRQFQCDLQVAVSVADRLRVESEQALLRLQARHRNVEEQLGQALSRQRDVEQQLENLRAEHKDVCCKLTELSIQQRREQAELSFLRNVCSTEGQRVEQADGQEPAFVEEPKDEGDQSVFDRPEAADSNGSDDLQLTGKGVAEGFICNSTALEKKKQEGHGQRDPRRIVMLCERSWSLSRLPLQINPCGQNGTVKTLSTTLPLCKKEEPIRGGRTNRMLLRQDSWSSFNSRKPEEEINSDCIRPQDGFSALLRRHGGSRRNSLLRWCQSQTQGYQNIEITNFSSCWEDGLAFCAVYHTYLPTHIPYDSLNPANKMENLDLAFRTGESVGIPATLTVDEMLKPGGPDWQRVLGYVESIFRHFEM